jgi:hypothetical protein
MAVTDYKDAHAGERVFIAGNGPSLEETPLSLLEDEYSIAMNRIDPLLNSTSWQPTYYVQVNIPPFSDRRVERIIDFNSRGISLFIHQDGKQQLQGKLENQAICEYVNIEYRSGPKPRDYVTDAENKNYDSFWSSDVAEKAYLWSTSLYTATQIAVYMGFDEIYFIGCDLYPEFKPVPYSLFDDGSDPVNYIRKENNKENLYEFVFNGGHPVKSFINGAWFRLLHRPPMINILYEICKHLNCVPATHFEGGDPPIDRFYQAGKNRSLINIHKLISTIGKHEGFTCYNATVGGQLEVHERVDLRDIV